jgi:hypothetical protein
MKKLIFSLVAAVLLLSATPALAQTRMRLLAPNFGEVWPVLSKQNVAWHIDGPIPASAYLQFNFLDGAVSLRGSPLFFPGADGTFALPVPLAGCWNGVCRLIRPGAYLVEAVLYNGTTVLAKASASGLVTVVYPE